MCTLTQGTAVTTAGHSDNNIKRQSFTWTSALRETPYTAGADVQYHHMQFKNNDDALLFFVLCHTWPRHNMSKDHSLCKHLTFTTIHPCVACLCDVDISCWHRRNSQKSVSGRAPLFKAKGKVGVWGIGYSRMLLKLLKHGGVIFSYLMMHIETSVNFEL